MLHDEVGPLLSAVGLKIQFLKMDQPGAARTVDEVQSLLEQAMDQVRVLVQDLHPSVVERAGLERALEGLAERTGAGLNYRTMIRPSMDVAVAMYAIAEWAAMEGSIITVSGNKTVKMEIRRTGSPGRIPALARVLAQRSGIVLDIRTGKSTIVTARYAI